ncbi:MAG: response regulator transcription factor [Anaerolineales bacterium]|nr:response regulator transcription factor [Anaerolineales bacterium]
MSQIRLFILDELPMFGIGLQTALSASDYQLVGIGSCLDSLPNTTAIDLFLLSLELPNISLPTAIASVVDTLKQCSPNGRILATTTQPEKIRTHKLVATGMGGCILKSEPPKTFAKAICAVHKGKIWFSQPLLYILLQDSPQAQPQQPESPLTDRETELLTLLTRGWTNQQIGDVLCIEQRTVKFHLTNIYAKLNIHSRTQAASWAWQHGLGSSS